MRQTTMIKKSDIKPKWYLIDATDISLGRLSSQIALILRGKHQPTFTPHADCGDNVIVVNATKVKLTGKKLTEKKYYSHSQHPSGLKVTTYNNMIEKKPFFPIERAVRLMLPKNRLGRKQFKNLFVYAGVEHPHAAQNPIKFSVEKESRI